MTDKNLKINCYSDGEGAFMEWSQNIRAKALGPLLGVLGSCGVRAGHVTLLSLICGLLFSPFFGEASYLTAFVFLLLHVLIDGIDGPLARYLGKAGDRGSFTDTAADQIVVTTTTISLILSGHLDAAAGGFYIFFYAAVVTFAFIRNALETPYSWLFRPRFVVFGWIAIEVFFLPGTLSGVVWAAVLLLGLKSLTGFVAIRRKI